jgi:hypothetical protein
MRIGCSRLGTFCRGCVVAGLSFVMESAADRMRPLMPDALDLIGRQLQYRRDIDRRLEELMKRSHPTVEEGMETGSLLEEKSKERTVPRCDLASLTGCLGRTSLKNAAPERSEDICMVGALTSIGPPGYGPILSRTLTEDNTDRLYVGVMALVIQSTKTDFPAVSGIGPQERWVRSFPKSRRGLHGLVRKWGKWRSTSESKYAWNPDSSLLEPK